jgi:hypothetical protein
MLPMHCPCPPALLNLDKRLSLLNNERASFNFISTRAISPINSSHYSNSCYYCCIFRKLSFRLSALRLLTATPAYPLCHLNSPIYVTFLIYAAISG